MDFPSVFLESLAAVILWGFICDIHSVFSFQSHWGVLFAFLPEFLNFNFGPTND